MDNEQKHMDEYKEVNSNMRHFSNMRVAVLTLCFAINGVLIQSFMKQENIPIITGLILLGIVTTFSLFIFESRVTYYYLFYQARAKELEKLLFLKQHSRQIPKKLINATNATKFLYLSLAIFWVILIINKNYK